MKIKTRVSYLATNGTTHDSPEAAVRESQREFLYKMMSDDFPEDITLVRNMIPWMLDNAKVLAVELAQTPEVVE